MTTKFSRRIIRQRNQIEQRGIRLSFNAIKAQYQQVYNSVGIIDPKTLVSLIPSLVTIIPIQQLFATYYPLSAPLAIEYRNQAIGTKASDDANWTNLFAEQLRHFGLTQTGSRIVDITLTTEKYIRGAVESAIIDAAENGLSRDKTATLIQQYLTDSLGSIGKSRSKMIAQTELITGSNRASQYGVESTGLDYRKFWSTSGLPNIRASHQEAENDSFARGGLRRTERFSNGLMYCGEPSAPPEEVINCRCIVEYQML